MPQQFEFPRSGVPSLKLNTRTMYLILGILLALWLLSGVYTVDTDEQSVILRFGKYKEIADPGIHYHLPAPIEMNLTRRVTTVYREEIGFRTVDQGPPARYRRRPHESLMLTTDLNIVDVQMVVQYRVASLRDALFSAAGLGVFEGVGEGLVHDACEAALRQVIGQYGIDEALTEGKLTIQMEIQEKLQELLDRYQCGLSVTTVQLQSVEPPAQVDAAFKDVASAKEDRERLVNEAKGYQNDVIPKARGEAERMIKQAEAYKIERTRRAQGDADRFRAVYAEYVKAPAVTETRLYLETMEKILPRLQKYVVETDGSSGLLNILNLDQASRSAATGGN